MFVVSYYSDPINYQHNSRFRKECPVQELSVLTRNRIVVRGGLIISVEEWAKWDGEFRQTLRIERLEEEGGESRFRISTGTSDMAHTREGLIGQVLDGFHPSIQRQYRELLELSLADRSVISKMFGFSSYDVVEEDAD